MSRKLFLFVILFLVASASAAPAEKPRVYFGINLRYHPITVYKLYQPMVDYLTANTPYHFELKISQTYGEAMKFLQDGKTQIASLGDGAVVEAMVEHGAIPLVKPLNEQGAPWYRCVFVVPETSSIRTLKDLRRKRVALGFYHSTTGNLVARQLLHDSGVRTRDLALVKNLNNHDAVIKGVMKGEFDAGAVKEVIARQYLHHGIRIVAASATIPAIPLVAGSKTPRQVTQAVSDALLKLDVNNPSHRKILDTWDAEFRNGFAAAFPADYRQLSLLFKTVPYGCGAECHR